MRNTAEIALGEDQAVPQADTVDWVEEIKPELVLFEVVQHLSPDTMLQISCGVAGPFLELRRAEVCVI